jgi:hypothetical protein
MENVPPSNLSPPQQALWWLKQGNFRLGPEWDKAHVICQQDEGNPDYDLVHDLCHWIEGDIGNRDYWYRRVGGGRADTVDEEWNRISGVLK